MRSCSVAPAALALELTWAQESTDQYMTVQDPEHLAPQRFGL